MDYGRGKMENEGEDEDEDEGEEEEAGHAVSVWGEEGLGSSSCATLSPGETLRFPTITP